ncbi:MAG TPA: hypothetical protein VFS44_13760 [Gemmatimonadaceae bacterium]|nr:hypothetical protein [Gemmatimonadaceae bacterium]
MAHTHEFDCRICGAHLDSRQELDQHNRNNHPDATSSSQAGDSSGMRGQSSSSDRSSERS